MRLPLAPGPPVAEGPVPISPAGSDRAFYWNRASCRATAVAAFAIPAANRSESSGKLAAVIGMPVIRRVVDDRVFLLGLDAHYRDAMKLFESEIALRWAMAIAERLAVSPADVPVEGYYTESRKLTQYFLLMRALQGVTEEEAMPAKGMGELARILEVAGSAMYGEPRYEQGEVSPQRYMLPVGRDPLTRVLYKFRPGDWNVPTLVEHACLAAIEHDDISLVGLAARSRDAVVLAALRESVILYAETSVIIGSDGPKYEYIWQVADSLAEAANRFIEIFNRLIAGPNADLRRKLLPPHHIGGRQYDPIPAAVAENAATFYHLAKTNEILGRCARIGVRQDTDENYHWAIRGSHDWTTSLGMEVDEFWSKEVWTSERYRAEKRPELPAKPPGPGGIEHLDIV